MNIPGGKAGDLESPGTDGWRRPPGPGTPHSSHSPGIPVCCLGKCFLYSIGAVEITLPR